MNTGAEAVESGIKVARKWGYEVKGVAPDRARIVVAAGGFHGRTTTIVGFSTDPDARARLRSRSRPASTSCPYGDADALRAAMTAGHGGGADRADPGRGRRGRAAGRLPGRGPGRLRRGRARCSWPTRCSPGSAAPGTCWPPGRPASTPTSTCWARRSAAGSCRCPRWWPTPTCSACCGPASTAAPSAATRWPARSAGPCSTCWPTTVRTGCWAGPGRLGAQLHGRLAELVGRGVVGVRGAGCGPVSTSSRARHRAGGQRGAGPARRAGQGHPRLDDPALAAAGDQRDELDHAVNVFSEVLTES